MQNTCAVFSFEGNQIRSAVDASKGCFLLRATKFGRPSFAMCVLASVPSATTSSAIRAVRISDVDVATRSILGAFVGIDVCKIEFSMSRWPREYLFFDRRNASEFDELVGSCFKKRGVTSASAFAADGRPSMATVK